MLANYLLEVVRARIQLLRTKSQDNESLIKNVLLPPVLSQNHVINVMAIFHVAINLDHEPPINDKVRAIVLNLVLSFHRAQLWICLLYTSPSPRD